MQQEYRPNHTISVLVCTCNGQITRNSNWWDCWFNFPRSNEEIFKSIRKDEGKETRNSQIQERTFKRFRGWLVWLRRTRIATIPWWSPLVIFSMERQRWKKWKIPSSWWLASLFNRVENWLRFVWKSGRGVQWSNTILCWRFNRRFWWQAIQWTVGNFLHLLHRFTHWSPWKMWGRCGHKAYSSILSEAINKLQNCSTR